MKFFSKLIQPLIFILTILGSIFLSTQLIAQTHNVATFNIRWDNPNDEGNLWKDRSPHVIELIQKHDLGIVGIQEGLDHQVNEMTAGLGYSYLGVGRDDGAKGGEYTAILFDSEKYELLDEGTFWLSPTPDEPSKGWDAALNRICSWGKFKGSMGEEFYVFNIHYDHIGVQARVESSKLVIEKSMEINSENLPAIWFGDFNVSPEDEAYKVIIEEENWSDARLVTEKKSFGPRNTFTGFKWKPKDKRIIDHVFVSSNVKVMKHGIIDDSYGKKYPSDHFPVMAQVEFQ